MRSLTGGFTPSGLRTSWFSNKLVFDQIKIRRTLVAASLLSAVIVATAAATKLHPVSAVVIAPGILVVALICLPLGALGVNYLKYAPLLVALGLAADFLIYAFVLNILFRFIDRIRRAKV